MKKIMIILVIVGLILTGCAQVDAGEVDTTENATEGYETFFEQDMVHEIYINISEDNWADMLLNPTEESFHEANITLDGITIENIAIRTKGNSTLRQVATSESDRYSLKIKINEYEDQKLLGLDEFVLNNMFSDASYLREYLSYEALGAMGSIVPMTSYIDVYVNDELIGFYLLVETVDDSFLNNNFGDNDGNLYRADSGTTLEYDGTTYTENVTQKNGDDTSKADLYQLMDILNAMPEGEKGDIESILDVDSVLNYIAGNTLMESYDSLNGQHVQNYYLYNDDGIFTLIPWDYNMSFGSFQGTGLTEIDIDEPVSGVDIDSLPLIKNLLAVEEYQTRYYEMLEGYITYFENFEEVVTELSDMIRPHVEADPTKFTTMAFFESNVVYVEGGAYESTAMGGMKGERPEGMAPPMGDRPEKGTPPEGTPTDERSPGGIPEGMGQQGGNMGGDDVSIINILFARIENIKDQLTE